VPHDAEAVALMVTKGPATIAEVVPRTLNDCVRLFASYSSPRLIAAGILLLVAARAQSPVSLQDLLVVMTVAAFWALQEWALHAKALHSDFDWFGRTIHTSHHEKPYHHVSIDGPDLVLGMMGLSFCVFWLLFGGSATSLTASATYFTCGLLYEWTHFIVHTHYVPTSKLGRHVRQHHMQHHCRNEDFWLAFTVPAIDQLFRTAPLPSSVPVSSLARRNWPSRTQ